MTLGEEIGRSKPAIDNALSDEKILSKGQRPTDERADTQDGEKGLERTNDSHDGSQEPPMSTSSAVLLVLTLCGAAFLNVWP